MEFLSQYGIFLAKIITLVLAIFITLLGALAIASKSKKLAKEKLKITKINDKYKKMSATLREAILSKREFRKSSKLDRKKKKGAKRDNKGNIFLLKFHGDIKASAVQHLREEITALLTIATPADQVVVNLESAGGMVHVYGLAASQLQRIREKKIPLTICIDKIAASGGYLMACVADRICAAPFAIIGSIGVVAQLPNFHRLLKKKDIDYELFTAGEYKRTVTVLGENTDKARKKFQEDLEDIHVLFKEHIMQNRPKIDIDIVATGEYWLAKKAIELQLLDQLVTSDDYLLQASENNNIYEVNYKQKKSLFEQLFSGSRSLIDTEFAQIYGLYSHLARKI